MAFGKPGSMGRGTGKQGVAHLGGASVPLLYDDFSGAVAALAGRIPQRGPAWGVTGIDAADVVAGGGQMYDSVSSSGVYYATSALSAKPREIGCKFTSPDMYVGMRLGGTVSSGKLLAIQVVPSGVADAAFTQVNYTTVAGDTTLAITATNFAAAISANATMIARGITAVAVGADIQLRATKCPRVRSVFATSPYSASTLNVGAPTLASWITGNNFLTGMVHFRAGADGWLDWSIYNGGGSSFTSLTVVPYEGLQTNTEYIYRCQISGSSVSGGLWDTAGNVIATATGSDSRIATLSGQSAFFESTSNTPLFTRAWATLANNQVS